MAEYLEQDLAGKDAIVVVTEDPTNQGRVKLLIPGYMEDSDYDKLPWVYLRDSAGPNLFCKLQEGDKVKVYMNQNNPYEFTYSYLPVLSPQVKAYIAAEENANVLCYNPQPDGNDTGILTTSSTGLLLTNAGSSFNVNPTGEIFANTPFGSSFNIFGTGLILIGQEEEPEEPAVLGHKLTDLLTLLSSDIAQVSEDASKYDKTFHLTFSLNALKEHLDENIKKILSDTVVITK